MNLPTPPQEYSANDQAQMRRLIAAEDGRNQKMASPYVLTASDGSRWKLVVSTAGALSTVAA